MDWNAIITMVIKAIIGLAVLIASTALKTWLAGKAEAVKGNAEREAEWKLFCRAQDAVNTVVDYVNQTMVDGIKGTEAWTEQAQKEAREKAYDMIEVIIGEDGMENLEKIYGSARYWVLTKVEQAVLQKK